MRNRRRRCGSGQAAETDHGSTSSSAQEPSSLSSGVFSWARTSTKSTKLPQCGPQNTHKRGPLRAEATSSPHPSLRTASYSSREPHSAFVAFSFVEPSTQPSILPLLGDGPEPARSPSCTAGLWSQLLPGSAVCQARLRPVSYLDRW